jgi:vacuolar-type H+-ATPase subunit C/Vma6
MYEFASGVINVLERRIFDKLDQERMLKSPNRESAFEVLFDTDMAESANQNTNIEKIIENDMSQFKKTLLDLVKSSPDLFSFLFFRFDALNLKIAFKKKLGNAEINAKYFPYGIVDVDKLEQRVAKQRVEINPIVEDVISRVESKILADTQPSSEKIECMVDVAYFEVKLATSKKIDSFLQELTRTEIDVANIKNLLKAKSQTERNAFIKGGNLQLEELEKLITLHEGEIFQDLKKFFEVFGLSLLIEKHGGEENQIVLENALHGFLTEKIYNKAKENGSGIAKVLTFFHKKMNSYANIRLIMFSKENDILPAEIEPILLPI